LSPKKVWLTPSEAAEVMSKKAGYRVTPDDIKQMRRRHIIRRVQKLNERITLYHIDEIQTVPPPKKHHPELISQDGAATLLLEEANASDTESPSENNTV